MRRDLADWIREGVTRLVTVPGVPSSCTVPEAAVIIESRADRDEQGVPWMYCDLHFPTAPDGGAVQGRFHGGLIHSYLPIREVLLQKVNVQDPVKALDSSTPGTSRPSKVHRFQQRSSVRIPMDPDGSHDW